MTEIFALGNLAPNRPAARAGHTTETGGTRRIVESVCRLLGLPGDPYAPEGLDGADAREPGPAPGARAEVVAAIGRAAAAAVDPLRDRDFQRALWLLYELHYDGVAGVAPDLEWNLDLLAARGLLEARFETAIRDLVARRFSTPGTAADPVSAPADVGERLVQLTHSEDPPELARFLARDATHAQFVDYLTQRATYHLRESDPQSFLLPRLRGRAKVALAEIQYDEYGAGRADRLHAALYARALADLGLPTQVSSYVPTADPTMLATVNVMTFFALHRRLRGAAAGHLAAFEATSSIPCRLIALGARRLGLPPSVAAYYDEHVEADAVHEQVAIRDICETLVADGPTLGSDVLFGAAACLAVDEVTAEALAARWHGEPDEPADRSADEPGGERR